VKSAKESDWLKTVLLKLFWKKQLFDSFLAILAKKQNETKTTTKKTTLLLS